MKSRTSQSSSFRLALYHDLPSGGAKRMAYEQARGLAARGAGIAAFLPATAEEGFLPLRRHAQSVESFERTPPADREQALTAPGPALLLRWTRFLGQVVRSEREIARRIDAGGFDVVLVHPSQFTQAPLVLRWLRTPSVYMCQESLRAAHEPRIATPLLRFGIRHTLGRLDRTGARRAGLVLANSRFMAARLGRLYGIDPEVVHPGVDADLFHPATEPRKDFVLAVGGLHPLKGFDFLVRALAGVPADRRPTLLIVSDRERVSERQRIDAIAAEAGVAVRYRFRVPEEELARLYGTARLVAAVSHQEPFGLVPLEAMACGTPVIAVDEGGFRETVDSGRTGVLAPRNVRAFSGALIAVLDDPGRAATLGAEGRREVLARWTWERSHDRLLEILHRIARDGRRPTTQETA